MEIRNEIPEAKPTDPDFSDADATLEFVPRSRVAPPRDEPARSEPIVTTMEVTEADVIEVHAAVAALEREERKVRLPPAMLPPKRATSSPSKKILSRQWLLIAAALGTWTFFVSLASLAAFGIHSFARAHSAHAVAASLAPAITPPRVAPVRARFIAEPVPPRSRAVDTSEESQASVVSHASSDEESRRSTSRFGILRFAHATNGALVDGEPRRVTGDALFLSCGAHRIRTSRSASRTVRVPCGKTVTL